MVRSTMTTYLPTYLPALSAIVVGSCLRALLKDSIARAALPATTRRDREMMMMIVIVMMIVIMMMMMMTIMMMVM